MPPNGGNQLRRRPRGRRLSASVPSTTETFTNSLRQQIERQQKHIKALRTQTSFQQVQLEWYKQHSKPLNSRYICWACDKDFTRQDHFYKHVRVTEDDQHKVIADFINQTFCLHCDTSLRRPKDLVRHKRIHDIKRPKDGIGLLAESDPESTLNLQVLSRDGSDYPPDSPAPPAVEVDMCDLSQEKQGDVRDSFDATPAGGHNPTTYPNNRETVSIPSASVAQIIPSNGWPVSVSHLSSAQFIGLPTNGFLGAPYDESQSQDGWTIVSSAQHIGLPTTNYSEALGNEFLGVPHVGSQSQGEWNILESSAQYIGLPMVDYSAFLDAF